MPEDVTPQGGAPPAEAGHEPQAGKGKEGETVQISRAEFEAIRRERDEAKASERFWASRAQGPPADQVEEQEEVIATDDLLPDPTTGIDETLFTDSDKWAEAVSKGPAAIEAFLKKGGYVKADQVAEIARKVAQRTVQVNQVRTNTDTQILTDFPQLRDQQSDLYKATAEEVRALVAMDPSARNRPSTLIAAARTAKATLAAKAAGERRRPRDADPDDYDDRDEHDNDDRYNRPEPEADRRRRAAAQDGTTRRGGREDDGDSYVGPQAREVMRQMGIEEKDYVAEARRLHGEGSRARRRTA